MNKPATHFIRVRPPGLEPGSTGYKPVTLTFELWAHVQLPRIRERHSNVLPHRHIFKEEIAGAVSVSIFIR